MRMNFNKEYEKDTESPSDDDMGARRRREKDISKLVNKLLKYYPSKSNANSPLHINRWGWSR